MLQASRSKQLLLGSNLMVRMSQFQTIWWRICHWRRSCPLRTSFLRRTVLLLPSLWRDSRAGRHHPTSWSLSKELKMLNGPGKAIRFTRIVSMSGHKRWARAYLRWVRSIICRRHRRKLLPYSISLSWNRRVSRWLCLIRIVRHWRFNRMTEPMSAIFRTSSSNRNPTTSELWHLTILGSKNEAPQEIQNVSKTLRFGNLYLIPS